MHPPVVHLLAFAARQHMEPTIAEPRLLTSQRNQTRSQAVVVLPRLVVVGRYRNQQQTTGRRSVKANFSRMRSTDAFMLRTGVSTDRPWSVG